MQFSNKPIASSDLPQLTALNLSPVREDYPSIALKVLFLFYTMALFAAVLAFVFVPGISELVAGLPLVLLAVVLTLLLSCLAVYTYTYAKTLAYGIREQDIVLSSGVFWRREIVQPLRRVQHVELNQGPVDKHFNLVKIKLFGAGSAMSTFVIPGLDQAVGNRIKQYVLDYQDGIVRSGDGKNLRSEEPAEPGNSVLDQPIVADQHDSEGAQ